MGQKDLSEKILADYNDVFADIINVLILGGQSKIQGKDLIPDAVHSQYKADDGMLSRAGKRCLKILEETKDPSGVVRHGESDSHREKYAISHHRIRWGGLSTAAAEAGE